VQNSDWIIDAQKIEPIEVSSQVSGIDAVDSKIGELYRKSSPPFDIRVLLNYARHLNVPDASKRASWVYKLLDMDYSLGPGGYGLRFNFKAKPNTYGFYQLLKYDAIYRPMKYVYMPFGMTSCPACFSRDIAENACAHVHECVKDLFAVKRLRIHPKATLGKAISMYPEEFDSDVYDLIDSVNRIVYGRAKHKFDVELPRLQLLSLAESLAIYFVCRKLGLTLLQWAGTLDDIVAEIKRGMTGEKVFIGMTWFI
jgi:hypothetical protein